MSVPKVKFGLVAGDALLFARVMLAHSNQDSYTPVLDGAQVSIVGEKFVGVATDRYTVGRVRLNMWQADSDGKFTDFVPEWSVNKGDGVVIPRAMLTWLSKHANAFKSGSALVEFTFSDSLPNLNDKERGTLIEVRIADRFSACAMSRCDEAILGNYPLVAGLIDGHVPGESGRVTLNPDLMLRAQAGFSRRTPVRFEHGVPKGIMPAPVKFVVLDDHVLVDGLIQPNRAEASS